MWFPVFAIAFLGAVAYYQAIQGLTSASITCVVSILCMALAFTSFEYVADTMLMGIIPDFAYPVALFATFVVPFGILRLILDKVVPRSNLFPQIVDWIGGGAMGALAAVVITGILTLSIELVPWGSEGFIGYTRFDPEHPDQPRELWLKPDRATVWMAAALSDGAFSSRRSFFEDHPDWVSEIGWVQSQPRGIKRVVPADSVQLVAAGRIPEVYNRTIVTGRAAIPTYDPVQPRPGNVFTRVTLQLSTEAADADKKHRYTPASVRLVGTLDNKPVVYHAMAAGDRETPHRQVAGIIKGRGEPVPVAGTLMGAPPNGQIDVVFEHPERLVPQFVEYKIGGRVPLPPARIQGASSGQAVTGAAGSGTVAAGPTAGRSTAPTSPASPPGSGTTAPRSTPSGGTVAGSATPTPAPPSGGKASQPGGRVSGVRFRSTHFGGELPLKLTAYQGQDVEHRGEALEQGHLEGYVADQGEKHRGSPISSLKVPEGKVLLQLNVESLRAGSTLGRALNWSVQTVENYLLHDDRGKTYQPVGKFAMASVGGQKYFELLYFPEFAQSAGHYGQFSKIRSQHLKGDYQLVYLFLVDPGARLVKFTTGSIKRPVDLSKLNLVAH